MGRKLTEQLGIYGWSHLDPVLLAGLALRAPVLLVGAHGTGKSLLIERLAAALGKSFRHYNASLMNYDDLIGIPIPDNSGLRFVASPGGIWGAEFVFFDEISRCRPDLQNKLFPIIHEKRVAGVDLPDLEHCWAAMNPPATLEATNQMSDYIGTEHIDLALADRFQFIIPVPAWKDLDAESHRKIVAAEESQPQMGILEPLIADCREKIQAQETEMRRQVGDYIVYFIDLLHKSGYPQSPRRARLLVDGLIATNTALNILWGAGDNLEMGAELVSRYGLPLNAHSTPPSAVVILSAHKQAWQLAVFVKDERWRAILAEPDPLVRINLADELNMPDEVLSRLVTQALSTEPSDARCVGLSAIFFLRFRTTRNLTPGTWELLVKNSQRMFTPRALSTHLPPGQDLECWKQIKSWLASLPGNFQAHLESTYVLGGFPDLWRNYSWHEALQQFRQDLELFRPKGGEYELAP